MNNGRNVLALGLCVIGIALIAYYYFGSPKYGEVGPDAYAVAKAVYGACLAEDDERLGKAVELVKQANTPDSSIKLTDQEKNWLNSIIQKAQNGKWQVAANMARQLMKDQVKND